MGTITLQKLQEEHSELYQKCDSFCKEILRQLTHLIEKSKVKLAVPIQYRAKEWSSIQDKVEQGRYSISKSLKELQDLVGLRIILLFQRDVDVIVKLIEDNFVTIKMYNTGDKLDDNQFGYSSIHIIAKVPDEWLKIPTLSDYTDLKIEFQIRTLSQHSWAEASNIFQYKQEENVPKPLKRSIGRISALLETVDLEYERLLVDREVYKNKIKTHQEKNVQLNVDILEEVLNTKLPPQNKGDTENYSELLEDLKHFNINNKEEVVHLIQSFSESVLDYDKQRANSIFSDNSDIESHSAKERASRGVFYTHEGLIRMMLRQLHGEATVSNYLKTKYKK